MKLRGLIPSLYINVPVSDSYIPFPRSVHLFCCSRPSSFIPGNTSIGSCLQSGAYCQINQSNCHWLEMSQSIQILNTLKRTSCFGFNILSLLFSRGSCFIYFRSLLFHSRWEVFEVAKSSVFCHTKREVLKFYSFLLKFLYFFYLTANI